MTGPAPNVEWYIARDGKQHGPLTEPEMQKLREYGHLRPTDLVWRQGFPDWRPVAAVFQAAPQPAARAPEPAPQPAPQPAPRQPSGPDPRTEPRTGGHAGAAGGQATSARPGSQPGPHPHPGPHYQAPQHQSHPQAGPHPGGPRPAAGPAPQPGPRANGGRPGGAGPAPGPNPQGAPVQSGRPVAPMPASVAAGLARPQQPMGQTGDPARPVPAAVPRLDPDEFDDDDEEPPRRSWVMRVAIALITLTIIGGGGWLAFQHRDALQAWVGNLIGSGGSATAAKAPPKAPVPAATAQPGPVQKTAIAPSTPAARAAPGQPPPPIGSGGGKLTASPLKAGDNPGEVDATLQQASVWRVIRAEFPDWYAARLAEVQKMVAEKRGEGPVARYLVESVVQLRRANAQVALTASPQRLRLVATSFLDNIERLQKDNIDACYGFISNGEGSATVLPMFFVPQYTELLHRQVTAVFEAIAEGRKAPQSHLSPRKSDYDLLAGELTARGWSQADLQLFSDPAALSRAKPDRVCKMVRDWFAAQIAIPDPEAQSRLLFESLRPVVAG